MSAIAPIRRAIPAAARVGTWHAPDGWPLRCFDWPAADPGRPRGAILFQAGRGDVFEKYLEAFGHWHAAGWSVTSFDWRGQGGSGRLSADARVGHLADFAPLVRDLADFWRGWAAARAGPRVLIGHSMGGHLALRAMTEAGVTPDAAVLVSPMLGLRTIVGARLGEGIARLMRGVGDPARAAWKGPEGASAKPARLDRQKLLTADASRYADEQWWYDQVPEIRLGPPSWSWLAEAFGSTRAQREDPRLAALAVPLLTLVADADGLVDARAAAAVTARIPGARLERFGGGAAHELLREADPVRDRALASIDTFLDAAAPAP